MTFGNLSVRLLIVVVVALLPAIGLQGYSELQARHVRQQLMEDEALRLLHLVRSEQQRIIEGAAQVLTTIISSPAVQAHNSVECSAMLANLLRQQPRYLYADVSTPSGAQFCTPGPVGHPLGASDRLYFQRAVQNDGPVVGEYVVGRFSGQPTIHVALSYHDALGAVAGVAEVGLSLTWLNQQLMKLDLPPGSIVTVADHNGIFLARRPEGMALAGKALAADRRFLVDVTSDTVIWSMPNRDTGRPMLVAASPPGADPYDFTVIVSLDEQTTFADIHHANVLGIAMLMGGVIIALGVTGLLGNRLIRRPVARLLQVAERWQGGDLTARTGMAPDAGEFGRVAAQFERMAEALEARERALKTALDSTTDAVLSVDRDWRVTYLNRRALAVNDGVSTVGKVIWEAYPRLVGSPWEEAFRAAMRSDAPTRVDGYYERLDGWFEANFFPSSDGMTTFVRDVTEERRSAIALRESEERLRLSQEAGRIGTWDRDLITGKLHWSDLQCRQFGIDPADRDSVDFETWRRAIHPEDLPRMLATQEAELLHGADTESEYRIIVAGNVRWLYARSLIIRDADGRPVRKTGIDMDITERRVLEDELRRLTAELEVRVQQEVAARQAAQARAAHAERLQALGQLAGGIAHDFNNVLQAISGAIALMQRRLDDPVRLRRLTTLASEATERGAAITRRLLAFGRRGDLRLVEIDPALLLHDLREILAPTLGTAIEIQVTLAPGLRCFVADRRQLETTLINLATNARDAMPRGGRLTLSADAETVAEDGPPHPEGLDPGRYVRLKVTDNGSGMDEATLARASEPFFTTKDVGQGTGLGLAMSKGFVEQSGGALRIDSVLGAGTTVTLWLPEIDPSDVRAAALSRAGVEGIAPAPIEPEYRTRVLLVDDHDAVREVLAMSLEEGGYAVLAAANGSEALALLSAGERVDAVVTDLTMPGMDGLALIRAIRTDHPGIPAVVVTGYTEASTVLAAGEPLDGTVTVFRKPVEGAALTECLGTLLAGRTRV